MASETLDAALASLKERHNVERAELEERIAGILAAANALSGKSKKAALASAERDIDNLRYEQAETHRDEIDSLEDRFSGKDAASQGDVAASSAKPPMASNLEPVETEAEIAKRKKEKALKKKQNKAAKEREKEEARELARAEEGPSARQLELEALGARLSKLRPSLRMVEVPGDGHCLYRSVADQVRSVRPDLFQWRRPLEFSHEEIRCLCADEMLGAPGKYEPFAELNGDEGFADYCRRVRESADWGGQLELTALSSALGISIVVHRANESTMTIGEGIGHGAPLQVAYLKHYYTLGEHYNSVVPA